MLRKLIRFTCVLSILFVLSKSKVEEINYEIYTNKEIKNNYSENYIEINNYKLLIKTGNEKEILDNNFVYMMDISDDDNLFLAGHNSKLVFRRIYDLNIGDSIYVYLNNKKHEYEVIERGCIKVDDYSIYNKAYKKMVLITCTNDNQKRFIVNCKEKK